LSIGDHKTSSYITWSPMMKASTARRLAIVVLRVVITLLFAPAIAIKLRHPADWGQRFAAWGYPSWGAVVVSVAEIAGLVALWIPPLARIGIGILMVTLTGATATWLIHGPAWAATYPGLILVLVVTLARIDRTKTE
jgi:uncharacterized membrane protein YphA (DoxX/SURF4 family)